MSYEFFEIEKHGQSATLWLNRPEKRNAMGPAFWNELPQVMGALDDDSAVRAVVVAGRGKDFTVGLDLKAMGGTLFGAEPRGRFALLDEIERLQRSISSVAACKKPVIAAVHGYCLGGGIDLITACDIRVCSADASFSIYETKIAIVADVGTLQRITPIVGKGMAREMGLTGRFIPADRALDCGLVNEVHADKNALLAGARAMAAEIAANSPLAVQGVKAVLDYSDEHSTAEGLEYVAQWNSSFIASNDVTEALTAFLEKRAPDFKGD